MSKKSLDLEYMKEAVKIKSGIRAGVAEVYGIWPPDHFILYGVVSYE